MMVANVSESEAETALSQFSRTTSHTITVGCINSPKKVTLTGKRSEMVLVKEHFDTVNIPCRLLGVKVALPLL